ncbi:MAG: aspartate/glutamate racemase family protein [Candidatus Limnocylindrales bacterium]|jgi:Asp/Glu/hydantoin racemase
MPTVAMLHTSFVFVNVEPLIKDLFQELLPDVKLVDFVDSDVLATVQREGEVSPASVRRICRLAEAAEAARADVIFSACSSLGPAIDVARRMVDVPIVKIDDAMARVAVEGGGRVGVLATVPSTLGPTTDLIRAAAKEAGQEVEVVPRVCEGAFAVLMSGDRERHDAMVGEGASALARDVDRIVLAQASMARLAPRLAEETGVPVLASPRLGIEDVARVLATRVGVPA